MNASEGKNVPRGGSSVTSEPPTARPSETLASTSSSKVGAPARKVTITLPTPEERTARARELLERAKAFFPGELTEDGTRPGILARLTFPSSAVLRVCTWMRDEGSFGHCALVGAIDWRETREVVYLLWSDDLHAYLELSTRVPSEDPHLESVSPVWFGANWHEREAWDLLGVRFDHHPDLRRLFLPEGYQFHPLLKTFELHEPEELEVKARLGR